MSKRACRAVYRLSYCLLAHVAPLARVSDASLASFARLPRFAALLPFVARVTFCAFRRGAPPMRARAGSSRDGPRGWHRAAGALICPLL
eukprot:5895193-Pyramimonas_sp.AAC.1